MSLQTRRLARALLWSKVAANLPEGQKEAFLQALGQQNQAKSDNKAVALGKALQDKVHQLRSALTEASPQQIQQLPDAAKIALLDLFGAPRSPISSVGSASSEGAELLATQSPNTSNQTT